MIVMNPIVYYTVADSYSNKAAEDAMVYAALIALGVVSIMALIVGIDKWVNRNKDKDDN
jgi:hypothetical protein